MNSERRFMVNQSHTTIQFFKMLQSTSMRCATELLQVSWFPCGRLCQILQLKQ